MIHSISRTDSAIGLNFSISELEDYLTIPDPNIRCSLVYGNFLHVIIGKISGTTQGAFPVGYRINLYDYSIEPLSLSINNNSSSEFLSYDIANVFDSPMMRDGILYNDGTNDWLVTITETAISYNGFCFVKIGLSSGVTGTVILKKITDILIDNDLSNIVKIDSSLVFLSKYKVHGSTYNKVHSFNLATEEIVTTDITTNLLGEHTIVSYNGYVNIFGGIEWDDEAQIKVPVYRKFTRINMVTPSTIEEVLMIESSASVMPDTLSYAPHVQVGNKTYLISNTPDNAAYLIDMDSLATSRLNIGETNVLASTSFVHNSLVYTFNTNKLRLISFNAVEKTYSLVANNLQFTVDNFAGSNHSPFFKYNLTKKDSSIYIITTTTTELV